jgi:hypothetical protein
LTKPLALAVLVAARALCSVQAERLLAKHVQAFGQRCVHHLCMHGGRRGNDDGIQRHLRQHGIKVRVGFDIGVLVQHIQHITRGIAHGRHLHARVRVDHGVVRQAHFS